jgi:hypothetical protein
MDTDDLTPLAHETLSLAYDACDPLRADLGAGARDYKTEDEYLRAVEKYLRQILKHPKSYLEYWNLEDEIQVRAFSKGVKGVLAHVEKTLATPRSERGKPPFES